MKKLQKINHQLVTAVLLFTAFLSACTVQQGNETARETPVTVEISTTSSATLNRLIISLEDTGTAVTGIPFQPDIDVGSQ